MKKTDKNIEIKAGRVFVGGIDQKAVLSQKPANPQLYDTYEVEVEDEKLSSSSEYPRTVIKLGTTHKKIYVWNGVGWACITPEAKNEKVTIHE